MGSLVLAEAQTFRVTLEASWPAVLLQAAFLAEFWLWGWRLGVISVPGSGV